jgi:hypothetical protein
VKCPRCKGTGLVANGGFLAARVSRDGNYAPVPSNGSVLAIAGGTFSVDSQLSIRSLLYEYLDDRPQEVDAAIDSRDGGNFHRVLHVYVDFESADHVFDTISAVLSEISVRQQLAPDGSEEHYQLELVSTYLGCLKVACLSNILDHSIDSTRLELKMMLEMELRK